MKLRDRKIEIIDTTLVHLWQYYRESVQSNPDKINELIKLIYLAGADYIEVTEEIYEWICNISSYVKFKFNHYRNFKINNVEELDETIKNNKDINKIDRVRITGLDSLIFIEYEEELLKLIDNFGDDAELSFGDEFKSSIGMAIEWIRLGGRKVVTSFSGISGNTPFEQFICALRYMENKEIRGDFTVIPRIAAIYEEVTGSIISCNKPIIGNDIFNVESGIHVDGIIKNSKMFEPYNPHEIGRTRKIIIGKHSGLKSIEIKLGELNIHCNLENLKSILKEVRYESANKRRALSDEEILSICEKEGVLYEKRCAYC